MSSPMVRDPLERRVRVAYELGRLRTAALWALLLATTAALVSSLAIGISAAAFAPVAFVLWLWIGWRGEGVLRGARYGLLAGVLTFLLPMSVLRPCCRWDAAMSSCTMPEVCVALGALAALPFSIWALSAREPRRMQVALGMWLGAVSVATFKCSALFFGEALGLLGGVALGMAAASAIGLISSRSNA